jgi:hypothetical protein
MVHREAFINKIRELRYTYKSQQLRTQLWRKRGGTHVMFVPLCDLLEDDWVTGVLRQAGIPDPEIRSFIAMARS